MLTWVASRLSSFHSAVESERPDATVADVVVAAGRGLKAQEKLHKLIEDLADKALVVLGEAAQFATRLY